MKNGNGNIRLVTDEAPSRLLQKHSPARMHLAGLINRKLSIESTLRHLVEAGDKLREAADAERHAAAALVALDAEETRHVGLVPGIDRPHAGVRSHPPRKA